MAGCAGVVPHGVLAPGRVQDPKQGWIMLGAKCVDFNIVLNSLRSLSPRPFKWYRLLYTLREKQFHPLPSCVVGSRVREHVTSLRA